MDNYRFGSITIDGAVFTDDVIIFPDRLLSPWWRAAGGHVFAVSDLGAVLETAPEVVVLGTGSYGRVEVPEATVVALRGAGAEVIVAETGAAVAEFNRRADAGEHVVAALHLTC